MPTYTFSRPDGTTLSQRLTMAEYDKVKTGELSLQDEDGQALSLVFNPGNVGFIMRDGNSGGWATKAMKENKYREGRGKEMTRREKSHVKVNKLVPNYNGQEGHSWSDVQDHVRSEKGREAAKTYDHLVGQEKKGL